MASEKRLIDANSYIEEYQDAADMLRKIGGKEMNMLADFYCEIIKEIEKRPTVDAVEVVHGRWIVENEESIRCSECCFNRATIKMPMDYCPNCGADMRGDRNS